jgi:hypothetical protein
MYSIFHLSFLKLSLRRSPHEIIAIVAIFAIVNYCHHYIQFR